MSARRQLKPARAAGPGFESVKMTTGAGDNSQFAVQYPKSKINAKTEHGHYHEHPLAGLSIGQRDRCLPGPLTDCLECGQNASPPPMYSRMIGETGRVAGRRMAGEPDPAAGRGLACTCSLRAAGTSDPEWRPPGGRPSSLYVL